MEFIVLSLGYFALLGCMVYKGADVTSILGAAGIYVSSYLGLRRNGRKRSNEKGDDNGE